MGARAGQTVVVHGGAGGVGVAAVQLGRALGLRTIAVTSEGSKRVNRLLLGNTTVVGVASREFFEHQPALVRELWDQLLQLRATGELLEPPVDRYPFPEARSALRVIADRRARGKIILSS